jgi:ABC-type Fe3+ transport system permease subunit
VALALVFLFAFAEFEMASLLGIKTWTVSLFDAQAGGLVLSESLRRVLLPALCELAVLGAALAILFQAQRLPGRFDAARPSRSALVRGAAWAYLVVAAVVVSIVPLMIVLRGTWSGIGTLARDFVMSRDILSSLLFALVAAGCAYLLAGLFVGAKGGLSWACALSAPGLLGPLVLALIVLSVFQFSPLRKLYDTPLPLACALTLLFLPFALLLRMLLSAWRPNEALHAAELLRQSGDAPVRRRGERVVRFIRARGRFWVLFLLFTWAYFDLTASSILAPSKMTPVFVRLYNLMHYGQISVLSAMVCVAVCVPLLILAIAGGARALYLRAQGDG